MLIKTFQVLLAVLVAFFTIIGLTLLFGALESTLLATIGIRNFAFAVSARSLKILVLIALLFSAAALFWLKRRSR